MQLTFGKGNPNVCFTEVHSSVEKLGAKRISLKIFIINLDLVYLQLLCK